MTFNIYLGQELLHTEAMFCSLDTALAFFNHDDRAGAENWLYANFTHDEDYKTGVATAYSNIYYISPLVFQALAAHVSTVESLQALSIINTCKVDLMELELEMLHNRPTYGYVENDFEYEDALLKQIKDLAA